MKEENLSKDIFDGLDPKKYILIKNARVNNLKNLSVAIPRNALVVITGVSGSGKSSLAFDTLYAEGQRMYVESLSSYARQFLGRMEKPDVDYIRGISPAIAIEQKVNTRNPRSTVGTTTEIYDYIKLLYARIGTTYSPISGKEVKKDNVSDIVAYILSQASGTKYYVLAPLAWPEESDQQSNLLKLLLQKGFTRIYHEQSVLEIEEALESPDPYPFATKSSYLLVDRAVVDAEDQEATYRVADSVQTALFEGHGTCVVHVFGQPPREFSDRFELDGMVFEEPSVNLFTFNNPFGACKTCDGFGHVLGIDPNKVFPNKNLSVYEGAIAPWRGEKMSEWLQPLLKHAIKFDFPIHRALSDLNTEQMQLLWTGNEYFKGLHAFFAYLEGESYKIQYRVMLSRYRGRTVCPDCKGTRLRKDAHYVLIESKSIADVVLMPIQDALAFFQSLTLTPFQQQIATRLLTEIITRLQYLDQVGLGYLTLNRLTNSLSGGEFQRIKLATSLGSALVGSMYILDEPSIGLHPRDTSNLIQVLKRLRDMGNTVIVVEHEEEVMRQADLILDIGPDAGTLGGQLVAAFRPGEIPQALLPGNDLGSHTYDFLSGRDRIPIPKVRRTWTHFLEIQGARENNLKNIHVRFPLEVFCAITGVSGSGKSTLIKKILYPAISRVLDKVSDDFTGDYDALSGSTQRVKRVEFVDQNPIGKSSRSNPVTYTKTYDAIRNLMCEVPLAKSRGYKPAFFSFNMEGGRCETCQGEGYITIEMQFMADVTIKCESCKGRRFREEVLDVKYNDLNISDILNLTIDEAVLFFKDKNRILERLLPLQQVGLGYVKLGQSSNTLSGGEAQRIKLATFIAEGQNSKENGILFFFDEPTTGLHFHDISKLLRALQSLVNQGNTVVVIEHNMEVIKSADWIIDLGPEGGQRGGSICAQGTPEEICLVHDSPSLTVPYLRAKLQESQLI